MVVLDSDSFAENVSTFRTNTESASVNNSKLSEHLIGRKYALTNYDPIYLRSWCSEYSPANLILHNNNALLILDKNGKWYQVRFMDDGKQYEGWIRDADADIYVEEYFGEFDDLIKNGVPELKKITVEREKKKIKQEIYALEIKNKEISDLDYKGKIDVYEELSKIDVENRFKYKEKADFYRDKLNQDILEKEKQVNIERIKRASELIGSKVYIQYLCDFRTEPNFEGEHIFTANPGAMFTVISIDNNGYWYKVKSTSRKEGYIAVTCVTTNMDIINKIKTQEDKKKKQIEQAKNEKIANLIKKHPSWSTKDCQIIAEGKVRIGMDMEQCKTAWGKPSDINNTIFAHGTHTQWCYGEYCSSSLYFNNGILTAIMN